MSEEYVDVKILPDGTIEWETMNFKGRKCEQVCDFIKKLGEVVKDEKKDDYYAPPDNPNLYVKDK